MTFPQTKLDVWARLQINGTWVDVSGDVRSSGTDAITITRGISASGGVLADRGSCSLTLDNNSGNYSARNPLSPHYPYLGLNTPLQVGAAYGTPWLDSPYGAYQAASTPDASVLDVTGDLDVRVGAELPVWGDAAQAVDIALVAKWAPAGDKSWYLGITPDGRIILVWCPTSSTTLFAESDRLRLPPWSRRAVRATLDVNNGAGGWTVVFYTADTLAGTWTQVGSPVTGTGTTAIFSGSANLLVGSPGVDTDEDFVARKIYAAEVRSGIGGTVVANPSFESQAAGTTSFVDTAPSPRTWTAPVGAITNRYLRFSGEVSEWPPQWTTGGQDVTTPITATGLLQRYGQAKNTLRSPMRQTLTSGRIDTPLAYWPMEDGPTATQAASGLLNGSPMRVKAGAPRFGATVGPAGSLALPDFSNGGTLHGALGGGVASSWTVECLVQFPTDLPLGFAAAISWTALGTRANVWEIDAQPQADGGLSVQWADTAFDDFGGPYYSNIGINDGKWHQVRVTVAQSGTAISIQVWLDGTRVINTSEASVTLGAIRTIDVNGGAADDAGVPSVGHLAVWSPSTTASTYLAVDGYDGDTMTDRLLGVILDEAVPLSIAAIGNETELMGPQPIDTLLNVITDAVRADEGLLYETRERLGIRARGRATLYNQASALDLSYVAAPQPLMAPLTPVGDLQGRLNDSTVTRTNGSSGRYQVIDGRLSVQEPPLGIGSGYDENVTLNLYADGQTVPHAAWRAHVGTVDADRFPQVNVWLEKAPSLIPQVCRLDTGSRMRITPPLLGQLPPDAIDQLVLGYTETLAQVAWRLSLACQPYAPYQVGVVGDVVLGKADTSGSTLASSVTASGTTLSVATTSGPLWTADPAEAPWDVRVGGGEVMRVEAVGTSVLNANAWMDSGISGWSAQATTATVAAVTMPRPDGVTAPVLQITPDGVSASGGAISTARTAVGSITPGASYVVCMWAYSPGGHSDLRPCVDWYTAASAFISSSLGVGTAVPAGQWKFLAQTFTAPASASMGQMRARHAGTPPASAVWFAWGIRIMPVAGTQTSPQTMQVTRARNGISRTWPSGTDVRLAHPMTLAL
ncbi:hypothetical protein [Streptomyces sp. NRRL F-5123]|uniref:hypothetical protein n=1 Tax=Streptomyces sp. NRRL F-5123 TaxID=1463856 RepID=UPI0004E25D38|nr:hypothetical protein [Streptomyces sp. NRRL F-5123]